MTKGNKEAARQEIEELSPGGTTNLWHGLKTGLRLVADTDPAPYNIPALFVLTDGKTHLRSEICLHPQHAPVLTDGRIRCSQLYESGTGLCS